MAIERERQDRGLKAALAHQEVLTHRVKNSLAIVASMLQLQASHAGDSELTQQLEEAAHQGFGGGPRPRTHSSPQ
jgi:two-component sensor histidine kinase